VFLFPLGSPTPPVVIPPPPPPFWGPVTAGPLAWQAVGAATMPRFEHVFPQESGVGQQFVKIPAPVSK
jgi:hypothetical protein